MLKSLIETLIITATLGGSVRASEPQCTFLEQLSQPQREAAYEAYRAGAPYDLGYTAVAVAWKESTLCKFKFRYNMKKKYDRSVGCMHTAILWKTKGLNPMQRGIWIQNMVENDIQSLNVGVQDLLMWKLKSKSWREMLAHYNGGNTPNYKYADSVIKIYRSVKDCNFDE